MFKSVCNKYIMFIIVGYTCYGHCLDICKYLGFLHLIKDSVVKTSPVDKEFYQVLNK